MPRGRKMPYTIGDRKLITHAEKQVYASDFLEFDKDKSGALERWLFFRVCVCVFTISFIIV